MTTSRLARLPANLFAIPYGLFGLAGAWQRATPFGWPGAASVASTLRWLAVLLWVPLLLLYAAKLLRHREVVNAEFHHPVQGAILALIPLANLIAVATFGEPGNDAWLAFTLLTLVAQAIVAVRVVEQLATGSIPAKAVTPALYLPSVAGGFVGAMALTRLGYPGWAALLFGMGLAGWALLEARVLSRLFEGPMPEALRPTIGIEIAPPSIATLSAATLWPALPGEFLIIGLGIAAGPVLAVLARYRWWHQVPFSVGFWSFGFPIAALAGALVEVVRRGAWPPFIAGIGLFIASTVVALLAAATLRLWARQQRHSH